MDERALWLARRAFGFGASEVPALMVALGRRKGHEVPDYIAKRARHVVVRGTLASLETAPRIFLEKAGLVEPFAPTPAMLRGIEREEELISTWREHLLGGRFYAPHERELAASTIRRAEPKRILPLVDRECPCLCATPDAWADDVFGGFVDVQGKCGYGEKLALAWHHADQVQTEIAIASSDWGVLVHGDYWARPAEAPPGDGPIRSWPVERNDAAIAEIRGAAIEGWEIVKRIRETAEKEAA